MFVVHSLLSLLMIIDADLRFVKIVVKTVGKHVQIA